MYLQYSQFEFDSGFWSDVADEWNLSWVGQLKDTYAHDNGYTSSYYWYTTMLKVQVAAQNKKHFKTRNF